MKKQHFVFSQIIIAIFLFCKDVKSAELCSYKIGAVGADFSHAIKTCH